ncbi:MAG: erythromycin esterase family protein [bacterium]
MTAAIDTVQRCADPLTGDASDYDAVIERCEKATVVLLGEATHGTHEFYDARADITKRLVAELGFNAVAVEADWPDSWRLNQFVNGSDADTTAADALGGFKRFPQWMWRNSDVLDFAAWLRQRNMANGGEDVGFYGLDLYSLNESMKAVVDYLRQNDPALARTFSHRYACFDHFGGDPKRYGLFTGTGISKSCEEEVVSALAELRRKKGSWLGLDGHRAEEAFFSAEQNAAVVADAESYYRTMLRGDVASWNLRDRHMMNTLLAVASHLEDVRGRARIVVWAHNSHIGDARATQMGRRGEFNIGQLAREHFKNGAVLIGFTTHGGTVTAASDWDAPAERKNIRPALPHSCERLFHQTDIPRFWLDFSKHSDAAALFQQPMLERAIGVIYRPETERESHYFDASLSGQFDAIFHFDETRAVEPLERSPAWDADTEVDETYPSGL